MVRDEKKNSHESSAWVRWNCTKHPLYQINCKPIFARTYINLNWFVLLFAKKIAVQA